MPPTPWTPLKGGACDGINSDFFFPEVYDDDAYIEVPSRIKELCQLECPFYNDCLKWAMDPVNDAYGFWAATSRYQRLQLNRVQHRTKCPGCTSTAVMADGHGETCLSCGISWLV